MIKIPTQLLNEHATVPTYGSDEAAGMDLYANFHDMEGSVHRLTPGSRKLFKTGIAVAIPVNMYGRIAPRSGLAYKHGLDVMAGVIDSDYRGELGVILINHGDEAYVIQHGDRIAQMILEHHGSGELVVVDTLPETNRGDGKYGSTGR